MGWGEELSLLRFPIHVSLQELGSKPPLFPCILYGPTCDAFDKLFEQEVQLPELDVGDWLIFPSMGAYSCVMSSTFNGFLPVSICYTMGPEFRCLGTGGRGSHQDLNWAQGSRGCTPGNTLLPPLAPVKV